MRRAVIRIIGRVQGVFFRESAARIAMAMGIKGTAVNNRDGKSVKIVAEGGEADLNKFIDWCYNGPEHAEVERVEVEWAKCKNEFQSFRII